MAKAKIRWGDALDDDDALPPTTVRGPDDNGVKTIIEYYRNDKGDSFKKVTKLKTVTVEKKVYKVTASRRALPRFGAAAKETAQDSVTVQQVEEIPFERLRQHKQTSQEKKVMDVQTALLSADKAAVTGSLNQMLEKKRLERRLLQSKGLYAPEKAPEEEGSGKVAGSLAAPKPGSYVPPSLRGKPMGGGGGGGGDDSMQRRRDDNSVRVTNLSEDVQQEDLMELFRPFGSVARVFLAQDKNTGENRGFAFVNFHHREDAEKAIRTLDGYGYDNLILRVEWAAPRERP